MNLKQKGFTMVELLITIGIIAVIATVVVIALNPVELFKEARDAQRINDLLVIENIVLYRERINQSRGVLNTVYISQTDHTASCTTLQTSLPVLNSPWAYACAPGEAEMVNGTGWLPFNISDFITAGTLIAALPVDPVNDSTKGLYYLYLTSGTRFELVTRFESNKYQAKAQDDGGYDNTRYERGSNLGLWNSATSL